MELKAVKVSFRLYQRENSNIRSTFFEMIDGDREVKQTKGLAYILARYPKLLTAILALPKVIIGLMTVLGQSYGDLINVDFIRIDAEMLSKGDNPIRRDITISIFKGRVKKLVIVIEAKSAKLDGTKDVSNQLDAYFNEIDFPGDMGIPKLGISITKYNQTFNPGQHFISITWRELIGVLHDFIGKNWERPGNELIEEYYKFITKVDKSMKYYEKEVLSVPAGKTFEIIEKYNIHACPNNSNYPYKDPLFITFRNKSGGEMSRLFKIIDIVAICPNNEAQLESLREIKNDYIQRLLGYIEERQLGWKFEKADEYRFYILSESEQIELLHCPKPLRNNSGGWYYKLSEMFNGKKVIEVDRDK